VRNGKFVGYDVIIDQETLEPDSDIHAVRYDHLVSVTPLHYDLTAHVNLPELGKRLR
jgi:broad specificity polyphosphatase/5'/3'-nucleotidase SurE